jgi:hypothetical protein
VAVFAAGCGGSAGDASGTTVLTTETPVVRPSVQPPGGGPRVGFLPGRYLREGSLVAPGPRQGRAYELGEPAQQRMLTLAGALGLGGIRVEFGGSPWTVRRGEAVLQVWPETGGRWQYQRNATSSADGRPAPSTERAVAAAAPVFRAAGLDSSAAAAHRGDYYTQVTLNPKVGGVPTWGWETGIQLDASGVAYALGWLSTPDLAEVSDLLTADAAFERLRSEAARLATPQPNCIVVGSWTPPCPRYADGVTVTAARYVLAMQREPGPRLIPAWLFATASEPFAYPAARR